MGKHAYLVLAHNQKQLLLKLLRQIDDAENDIFLHIDKKFDINLDALGFIDPDITINIVKDGKIIEKKHIEKPEKIINIVKCKNPRCITCVERELDQIFKKVPQKFVFS